METTSLEPLDIEEVLQQELNSDACSVFALPVPEDLGATLPCALAERDGGTRMNPFVDMHYVTISVWAETLSQAMREADRLCGVVARLPYTSSELVQWRDASITALPFAARDSRNPTINRVQFTASVTCRTTL